MPAASKVRWSQLKVGVVATAAMIILAVLIFLLTSSTGLFQNYVIVRTYMDDASGMVEGAPVRLNGILIGTVKIIKLSGSRDPNRAVEFDMNIKERYLSQIPVDSLTEISAANLLGDKFLNITKGSQPMHVQAGGELTSRQAQDIPELMAQSTRLLQSLQGVVTRMDSMLAGVEAGQGNVGKFLKDEQLYNRLNAIAAEGQHLLADVRNGKGTISKLLYDDALYQEIRAPIKRLDGLIADLQKGEGTAGKLLHDPKLYEEAQGSMREIRGLISNLNAGKGTAGKLLNDEAVYQQIHQLVAKIDRTLDKIDSGQGTLGQLMINPQLYEAMTGTMREFQALAKDMRANPKKFLRIKLALF